VGICTVRLRESYRSLSMKFVIMKFWQTMFQHCTFPRHGTPSHPSSCLSPSRPSRIIKFLSVPRTQNETRDQLLTRLRRTFQMFVTVTTCLAALSRPNAVLYFAVSSSFPCELWIWQEAELCLPPVSTLYLIRFIPRP
jgi:hypothetical protein